MIQFMCNDCGLYLKSNANLKYHIKNEVCKKGHIFKCKFCQKAFIHRSSMYRHINNICAHKKKNNNDENNENNENNDATDSIDCDVDKKELLRMFKEMQQAIPKLEAEIMELKNKNKQLESKTNINNGIINNIGQINDINVTNYVLVGYGKEDMNRVDKSDLLRGIRSGFNSTLNLIDAVHFNPKYPEFHNVYISSMKNKYAMMYDGSDWTLVYKDDLIDKLYNDKRNYIEENLEDFLESLTKSQINALDRWMNATDEHQYVQKIKNDIKLMLYNKRRMITDPGLIELKEPEEIVIKVPKGNIIDPPYRTNRSNKVVIKEIRENAGRPGTKRKMAKAKRNN